LLLYLFFATGEVSSVALFHKLAYRRVKLRLREELSELNVLCDGISYEMRCHDLPRFPSDVKPSDIIFDAGNAASSFMVPLEPRMVPLG
jgi:hypothetical protein